MPDDVRLDLPGGPIRFRLDDDDRRDFVARLIRESGLAGFEAPLPALFGVLSATGQGVILDVGANTGVYSLLAAAASSRPVVAFEPLPSLADRLEANLALNSELAPRISVERLALSDREGQATFREHINREGFLPTSSTLEPQDLVEVDFVEHTVPVTSLRAWSHNQGSERIGLMKVDVEGHETALLRGAEAVIARDRPIICVELLWAADFAWLADFLESLGYVDVALHPSAALRLDVPHYRADAWNHVLCPREQAWALATACAAIGLPIR